MPTTELLPPHESRTLFSLADRIVPGDADKGGAGHLLRELAPGGALSGHYETCRSFLARVDKEAGGNFAALSVAEQDRLLTRLETNPETARPFRQIAEWITEGFYASPAGWDLVGFRPVDRETR